MYRLIVKHFGPLKDIDIELNKINLFIGENGSGKSVLGKLITVLLDLTILDEESFRKKLQDFKINFLQKNTKIKLLIKNNLYFQFQNSNISIHSKIKKMALLKANINQLTEKVSISANKSLKKIKEKNETKKDNEYDLISELLTSILEANKDITDKKENKKLLSEIEALTFFKSSYIPSERNFVSIISQSLSSFIVADIPLPKFFLQFSSDFENGANKLKELKVLNVHYKYGEGLDRHKVYFDEKNYLPLNESSSGIQAVIPLLVTYKYFTEKYNTIVIEEPEQNLFPKAQAEIIKYVIEQKSDSNNLFMMTHSPYVLSTLNNLIFAFKVAQISEETKEKTKDLIKEEQWINPNDFSAYYLENGVAKSIISKRGLISDNAIDDISEDITGEFDDLMQIYRDFKYAK